MRAVVLVGGRGTRLRPLTLTTPKQMLPVAGRPMIEWVLEHLGAHGVDEAVLSLGYRPDAFTDAYPDQTCAGLRLRYVVEDEPLDTAGAIAFAARSTGLDGETFVVVNGDVLTSLDVSALVAFHAERGAEATIALTPVEDPSRYGVVPTDAEGRVLEFIEKPAPGTAPTNLINAGTYVLTPEAVGRIPAEGPVSIERATFPRVAADGRLYAMASTADWLDAGTPATYLSANLARGATDGSGLPAGTVDPAAVVRSSVIGDGAVVGAGAHVEGSVLLAGARVGDGATVRSSILGWGSSVGEGASVVDLSVLGLDAVVGAGEVVRATTVPAA